jgi:hypothetical protein
MYIYTHPQKKAWERKVCKSLACHRNNRAASAQGCEVCWGWKDIFLKSAWKGTHGCDEKPRLGL